MRLSHIVTAVAVMTPCAEAFSLLPSAGITSRLTSPEKLQSGVSCRSMASSSLSPTMALGAKSTAKDVIDSFSPNLKGKVAVVTGGNSGIGTETVKALASAGCRVVLCSRSVSAGEKALEEEIKSSQGREIKGGYSVPDADVRVLPLDLADLSSVEALAKELESEKTIDYLVMNAGVMNGPKGLTKDGFERQIGTNHFGHAHLANLLLPRMKAQTEPSRIVVVASTAHAFGQIDINDLHYNKGRKYSPWPAYGQSKLANILYTKGLHDRLQGTSVSTVCLHPGVIATPLWRDSGSWLRSLLLPFIKDKTVPQGAATTVYACLADGVAGEYLDNCKIAKPTGQARDATMKEKLWVETEKQLAEATAKIAKRQETAASSK